jgi:hypothetical protein
MLLFMALWVPISATLFRRAVLTLWHAFPFLGLRFFPLFFFLLGGLHCFFFKNFFFPFRFAVFTSIGQYGYSTHVGPIGGRREDVQQEGALK